MLLRFIWCIFLPTLCFCDLSLQENIKKSQPGDYAIYEVDKTTCAIIIKKISLPFVTVVEINSPKKNIKKPRQWIENGAEGNTSWLEYTVDIESIRIIDCYSRSQKSQVLMNKEDSFFLKLLELKFTHLQAENRKKIGPEPLSGEIDRRKVWSPPVLINAKRLKNVNVRAYGAKWPTDNSYLSGKQIHCYFSSALENFYLPYWIQLTDESEAAFNIRATDHGKFISLPENH